MRLYKPALATLLLIYSCKVQEKNLPGTYRPRKSMSRLILHPDHRFEWSLLDPSMDTILFPRQKGKNFYTQGNWSLKGKDRVVLATDLNPVPVMGQMFEDSIARFTHISSFNFWNRFGDPVSIRYIRIPPSRPKPHYGNSLFFFAQDFKNTDTLQFVFDGYPALKYPGDIPAAIGNNIHKVKMFESFSGDCFREFSFKAKGKRLSKGKTTYILDK